MSIIYLIHFCQPTIPKYCESLFANAVEYFFLIFTSSSSLSESHSSHSSLHFFKTRSTSKSVGIFRGFKALMASSTVAYFGNGLRFRNSGVREALFSTVMAGSEMRRE